MGVPPNPKSEILLAGNLKSKFSSARKHQPRNPQQKEKKEKEKKRERESENHNKAIVCYILENVFFFLFPLPLHSQQIAPTPNPTSRPNPPHPPSVSLRSHRRNISTVRSSLIEPALRAPDDLVASILSKVRGTDRGVSLTKDGHNEVADVAIQLAKYCVDDPVKCPLIFGEWDVVYCSVPTSPGGGYRSALGRLVFNTNEMVQVVEAPETVRNRVAFSLFGFLDGEVSLTGKLNVLDSKWIQVIFEPPELKIGSLVSGTAARVK
uniref:Plastid lipid-associated protein/fibrillin conserved domain-containing protein n=1 Tax=Ananas comosus var. bracteatus TaxID=296719 RepID=A0A6V7QBN1_ANACO|nr:unnamed protein product [Ananas comosus var. bracteatus]